MASVNKVILVGNCGRDPEVRYLPSGQAVANVSIATSSKRKDRNSGEMIEDTQWHRITFYDRLAEIAGEFVKKGDRKSTRLNSSHSQQSRMPSSA